MIREPLERCRYTGDRVETMKLISWLMDRAFWFEVQLASEFEDGKPEWEVVCGQLAVLGEPKSKGTTHAQ
jgi:hypothetical protein